MSVCYNETREFLMNAFFQNMTLSEDLAINAMSNSESSFKALNNNV